MVATCCCIAATSVTGLSGTTHLPASSKAMTPAWSRSSSTSSALHAASLASASRVTPYSPSSIEPDLSITSTSAVVGRSIRFRTSIVTGSMFSSALPRYPPRA